MEHKILQNDKKRLLSWTNSELVGSELWHRIMTESFGCSWIKWYKRRIECTLLLSVYMAKSNHLQVELLFSNNSYPGKKKKQLWRFVSINQHFSKVVVLAYKDGFLLKYTCTYILFPAGTTWKFSMTNVSLNIEQHFLEELEECNETETGNERSFMDACPFQETYITFYFELIISMWA